jgi:hypothetical protein
MSNLDERYLDLIMEEAAEVIQCCTKIKRFGIEDSHPDYYEGKPNHVALRIEIGDLLATIDSAGIDVDDDKVIHKAFGDKLARLKTYGPDGTYLNRKNNPSS